MVRSHIYPFDNGTKTIIKDIERLLDLKNKNVDEMEYRQVILYIDEIALLLLKHCN